MPGSFRERAKRRRRWGTRKAQQQKRHHSGRGSVRGGVGFDGSRCAERQGRCLADTYPKVRYVIAELGYTSSLAAKSLRSRSTGVIGLIVPDLKIRSVSRP